MAYLRKIKNSWQLQYRLDGKQKYKQFSPDTPKSIVMAEKKRIEAKIALHKAGVKRFAENDERVERMTLRELAQKVIELRKSEVAEITTRKNTSAMRNFVSIVGAEMPVARLDAEHFDKFKKARYERAVREYERKNWEFDDDKIKRGVNKDLTNIRTVLRSAANKNIIPDSMVPKIHFYKTSRKILPLYLNDDEILAIAKQLDGDALLAFWIIRYTGARRSEVARNSLKHDNGLKWRDIDWTRNQVLLFSKGKERTVPLHPTLRKILLDRKAELGNTFDQDDHVIAFIKDTISTYCHRAIKKAGVNKPGAVHILRHTAITKVSREKGIRVAQHFAGHSDISTTQIYDHVLDQETEEAVRNAFA